MLTISCEYGEPRFPSALYSLTISDEDEIPAVISIIENFSEYNKIDLKGGRRESRSDNTYRFELHFMNEVQINISNFIKWNDFRISVYSIKDEIWQEEINSLIAEFEKSGFEVILERKQ